MVIKKIMNDPGDYVDQTLRGIYAAHGDHYRPANNKVRALVRAGAPQKGKVAIVTGGGSGHLPVFLGYVGEGLLDGCAVGNVFASPPTSTMETVAREVNGGSGVLFLYGNYQGDVMNFEMAQESLEEDGIECDTILVADDVASAPPASAADRRGIAGLVFAYKIAGAAAARGFSLQETAKVTRRALESIRTIGVALSPCMVPAAGKPTFNLGDDEMEVGMGIHGEPGIERTTLKTSGEISEELVRRVVEDGPFESGESVALLVNSLGATPLEELYILYYDVLASLEKHSLSVERKFIGRYACSMEMTGASLTLMKLDATLTALLDFPTSSPVVTFG